MCDHGKGRENVQMADKSPRSEQGLMTRGEGQRVTVNLTLTISLKANDADLIIIDNGNIKEQVKDLFPNGVDKVLELVGTRTLKDSLKCIKLEGSYVSQQS